MVKLKISFQNLLLTLESLLKILIQSKFRNILHVDDGDRKKGCILLGNGPSLPASIEKYQSKFDAFDLVCVNNFAFSQYYTQIKPKIYIISAPIYFMKDEALSPLYLNLRDQVFDNIADKTTWKLYMMVPFLARKCAYFQRFLAKNAHIHPLYFNTTPVEGFKRIAYPLYQKGLGMPRPHNVLIPGIMNCIKLQYTTIYLVGADHSWLTEISVNPQNEALVHHKHFYDENETKPEKMEDYVVRPRKLHEIVHKFYLTFKGYWDILDYAKKKDVQIYNASEHSMIDAFERQEIRAY
ncbi:MAG: hypothetical protein EBS17_08315 [Flavobacteriia bacterium]|nr:hypothetical protein [Flavobacteriia bacterium]